MIRVSFPPPVHLFCTFFSRCFALLYMTCCHAGLLPSSCPSTCLIFPRSLAFKTQMEAVGSSQMLVNLYRIHGVKPQKTKFLNEAPHASTSKLMVREELIPNLIIIQPTTVSSTSLFLRPLGHHTFNWIYVLKLFLIILRSQELNFHLLSQI